MDNKKKAHGADRTDDVRHNNSREYWLYY